MTTTRIHPSRAPRPGRMLVVTAGWGACFVAIRYGLADAPVLWFAAFRALLAGVALLAVAGGLHRPAPPRSAWPAIAVLALVNVTVAFAAMFTGTQGVSSGVAAVLANAQPLLIVLPAWALYRERPDLRTLIGLAVGFAGLVVTASPGGVGGGALLSLAAAAAITAGSLLARRLGDIDVVTLSGWQFLIGGLGLSGWAAAAEGTPVISWTPRFITALLFLALIGTALTYLIWFTELRRAPLVALSAWTMLTPVFGITLGWVLLHDGLSAQQGLGVALVLVALPIILLRRGRTSAPDTPGHPPASAGTSRKPTGEHRLLSSVTSSRPTATPTPTTAAPAEKPPTGDPAGQMKE
jgi:probable blue pigment (indigoidine) exporter